MKTTTMISLRNNRPVAIRTKPLALLASVAASIVLAAPAVAAEQTFGSAGAISIPQQSIAIPYPSMIYVSGYTEVVDHVSVTLSNLTHPFPQDLHILLVGPGGQNVVLLSDAGFAGTNQSAVTNLTITFDDVAPVQLRDFGLLTKGTYRPTDYPPTELFPSNAPAGPYGTNLAVFNGTNPNGSWNLFIMDDAASGSGFLDGWNLTIGGHSQVFSNSSAIIVSNTAAIGSPYPSIIVLTNVAGTITKVTATLTGLTHTFPTDLDILLVGPTGESVVLLSDAGNFYPVTNVSLTFDDSATGFPPYVSALTSGVFQPTNYPGIYGDPFVSPAPQGPYGEKLSVFNGTQPGGVWSLYVVDGYPLADGGQIASWKLEITTEPLAITRQPDNVLATLNTNVTFSVGVAAAEPVTYQWLLNELEIPGATNASLSIGGVDVPNAGSYSVVVASSNGVVVSRPALLQLAYPLNPAPDTFEGRYTLSGTSGMTQGTNFFTGKQTGEPYHGGKPGGSSVWFTWTAPTNGIVTFDTRGSSFDTLLGIYTGSSLSNLVRVARDDNRGGYYTSSASFNAVAGQQYSIAVDGMAGQQGAFFLNWILEITSAVLPVIYTEPLDQTVHEGAPVTLRVVASAPQPLTYQWLLNGVAVPDATNATLLRPGVHAADVGTYQVLVTSGGRTRPSETALLEIGPQSDVQSRANVNDVLFPGYAGFSGPHLTSLCDTCAIPPATAFISVQAGTGRQTQVVNNTDGGHATVTDTAAACSLVLNHAKFLGLQPEDFGEFVVDTVGSPVPTVLAVYQVINIPYVGPVPQILTCDRSDPSGRPCVVHFRATPGGQYVAAVGGLAGADVGSIPINWSYGVPLYVKPGPGANISISWFAPLGLYEVQSTAYLSNAPLTSIWQTETVFVSSSYLSGTNYRVWPVPTTVTNRFFRLRKASM